VNAVLAGILAALAAVLCAHGRHSPYDNYVLLAYQFLHGRVWIDPLWPGPEIDAVLFEGHRYVVNDPVPALLLLPAVAAFGLAANQTLLACLLCGIAVGAAWALLERIGVRNRAIIWLIVFFLAGTDLLWCSMLGDVWFLAQTSTVAFLMLALCELAGKRRGWLVALWFALALGSRFTVIMALPVLLWWVYDGFLARDDRAAALKLRNALGFCAVMVPYFALWAAYNVARWHVPWDAGHTVFYHQDPYMGAPSGSPFGLANVPVELFSFFLAPPELRPSFPYVIPLQFGTALWFTSPALLLAFFARRPRRLVVSLWLAAALVAGPSLLYYANGGSQFGMRHALDFIPFVLVLMGLATTSDLRVSVWRVAQVLIVWSAAAGLYGVWFWNTVVRPTS
jgi:hypothetical protein